jgi:hypothetical protein
VKKILLIDRGRREDPVSYSNDWVDAFREHSGAQVDLLSDPFLLQWGKRIARLLLSSRYDGIFVMHSVTTDLGFGYSVAHLLQQIKGPVFLFMGNEFKSLAAKVELAHQMGCSHLLSQLPADVAQSLYGPFFGGQVVPVAHALNEKAFRFVTPIKDRKIDVGYRGEKYPFYLGHDERQTLFLFFSEHAQKSPLVVDLAAGRGKGKRLPRSQWAAFLNSCKTTIGTETGANFLSMSDKMRVEVNAFTDSHPETSFQTVTTEVIQPLVKRYTYLNGRAISSRHFDAIGCGTCLISFPGRFNDILQAEEHYLPLEHNLSNADQVLSKMGDIPYLEKLSNRARAYVLENHCLKHRVHFLMKRLLGS